MDLPETKREGERPSSDSPLRAVAVMVGAALLVVGLALLAAVFLARAGAASAYGRVIGGVVALLLGGVLAYWGFKRVRPGANSAEASLARLVEQYEREGKSEELAAAREQLIQLLIEKDEQQRRTSPP